MLRLAAADPRLLAQYAYIVMTAATALSDALRQFLSDHAIPLVSKPIARDELLARLS